MRVVRIVALAALMALVLPGCAKLKRKLGLDECTPAHMLGESYSDVESLSRIVQLDPRPLRAVWARGQVGGPPEGENLPGGGDWEVVALLEFADADANKLTDAGRGEVMELEVPASGPLARELGIPEPPPQKPGECVSPMMKISGFGYDAAPFTQYFLKPVALVKIPESSFFVLWLSTRPPEQEKERAR